MSQRLWELAWLFLKLGTVSFGGPAAHVAVLEDEVVRRRAWLPREQFLDLMAATQLIPGPNALEMTAYVGFRRAGIVGSLVAAASFTLPAALMTALLAWTYQRYGALPHVEPFLRGVKPAVLAIIVAAVVRLGKTAIKNRGTGLIALAVAAAAVYGANEIATLVVAGLLGAVWLSLGQPHRPPPSGIATAACGACVFTAGSSALAGTAMAGTTTAAAGGVSAWQVGLFFLKVGAVLYGTGYVLAAYLRGGLVGQGWLTEQQLLDALAAGQVTPGPLMTTATFIGYLLAGPSGATTATVAIILPGLLVVMITQAWIGRLRQRPWSSRFLDAVNAASIGLTAVVVVSLAGATLVDGRAWLLAAAAAWAVFRWHVPVAMLVLGGGLAGLVLG
jgi:chromate transporter